MYVKVEGRGQRSNGLEGRVQLSGLGMGYLMVEYMKDTNIGKRILFLT